MPAAPSAAWRFFVVSQSIKIIIHAADRRRKVEAILGVMAFMNLRTPQTQAAYNAYRGTVTTNTPCFLCICEDVVYGHWKLVKNHFPYDVIAKPGTHFLLCPKRHLAEEGELDDSEIAERHRIIHDTLSKTFSCIMLNLGRARTHASHLHYHLWVNKD